MVLDFRVIGYLPTLIPQGGIIMTKKKSLTQNKSNLSRRHFLRNSAIGVVSASAVNWPVLGKQDKMEYSVLGRTGFKVSNIGFGGSRGNTEPAMIAYAFEKGINYIDTSEGYRGGNSEIMIGKGVKKFRDKVFITTKVGSTGGGGRITKETSKENIMDRVMASLQRLDTPYIDCLMMHGAGDPDLDGFDNPNVWAVFNQLKSEGKVKYFGVSSHHYTLVEMAKHVIASNKIDVILLAYNYLQRRNVPQKYSTKNWLKDLDNVLRLAKSKNVGVVTMKTFQGAQEAKVFEKGRPTLKTKLAAAKWSISNSNVNTALISLATFDEIDAYTSISDQKMEKEDWDALGEMSSNRNNQVCRIGCPAPCLTGCSNEVLIPDVLRCNMYLEDYGEVDLARNEYVNAVPKSQNAAHCYSCKIDECSKNCMFNIPVKERLISAHQNLCD